MTRAIGRLNWKMHQSADLITVETPDLIYHFRTHQPADARHAATVLEELKDGTLRFNIASPEQQLTFRLLDTVVRK